jgi:tetratricopeptide (TPR) repeat protein
MSLVNEMLNELQKEKSKGPHFDGMIAVKNNESRWPPSRVALYVCFFLLIAVVVWLFLTKSNNNSLINTTTTIAEKPTILDSTSKQETSNSQQAESRLPNTTQNTETVATNAVTQQSSLNTENASNSLDEAITPSNKSLTDANSDQPLKKSVSTNNDAIESRLTEQGTTNNKNSIEEIKSQKSVNGLTSTKTVKVNSKPITAKSINKPMIKISRKSLAEKELRMIASQSQQRSISENKVVVDGFLQQFSDLDSAWLGAINLVEDFDINYHSQLLTKALNNFPEQAAFRMIVVKQNIAQNDYANAFSELKKIDSKNWQQNQYRIAGFLAQKVSDHVSAIRFYNQLLKSKPNQGDINMAIAISLEALNETSLAVAKFQRALEDSSLKPIQRQFIAQRIAVLKG